MLKNFFCLKRKFNANFTSPKQFLLDGHRASGFWRRLMVGSEYVLYVQVTTCLPVDCCFSNLAVRIIKIKLAVSV
jgi:hypothetical protein